MHSAMYCVPWRKSDKGSNLNWCLEGFWNSPILRRNQISWCSDPRHQAKNAEIDEAFFTFSHGTVPERDWRMRVMYILLSVRSSAWLGCLYYWWIINMNGWKKSICRSTHLFLEVGGIPHSRILILLVLWCYMSPTPLFSLLLPGQFVRPEYGEDDGEQDEAVEEPEHHRREEDLGNNTTFTIVNNSVVYCGSKFQWHFYQA